MKFIPKNTTSSLAHYSGNITLENYIYNTKDVLERKLPSICTTREDNLTIQQRKILTKLQRTRNTITIKPADKNLGIVVMNTEDYLAQCTLLLRDDSTYRLAQSYPHATIKELVENTIAPFKELLRGVHTQLHNYLLPPTRTNQTPRFYGIPKIHKTFNHLPPMRPIVAQSNSPLAPSARFIDHILQPLAQSYDDYLQNSTSLILRLQSFCIPDSAILVTIDVESLYPSIPQTECLKIVYEQMQERRHLILVDPNLIVRLLHININFNYFNFAGLFFQQIQGTAMGAAFSPTIANIFMSVTLHNFLQTQETQPLLLTRYIDDIFIIWPNEHTLNTFLQALNNYHPHLRFTHVTSNSSVNFLDLTIYKGPDFHLTHQLDLRTFQKPQNLYQYLDYTSAHPKHIYRSIVLGECVRYLRSNTRPETYAAITASFQARLQERNYPNKLTGKLISRIKFSSRSQYFKHIYRQHKPYTPTPPVFKCHPPPKYDFLKTVILQQYHTISHVVPPPRFITLAHPTLQKVLIRAEVKPTIDQLFDLLLRLKDLPQHTSHTATGKLPALRKEPSLIEPCNNPKCITCTHLNCSPTFTSSVTKCAYPVRFAATCKSSNIIYLITCTKCKKQYVGLTTKQLNTRINHHRSNIFRDKTIYISIHFNFPDHSVNNLSVQIIDRAHPNTPNPLQRLQELEKFWIYTLKTLQPQGLNSSPGATP